MKEWLNDRNVKTNSVLRKKMVKITYPHYWFFCKTMIYWCAANWNKSDRISFSSAITIFLGFHCSSIDLFIFVAVLRPLSHNNIVFRVFITFPLYCWKGCSIGVVMNIFSSACINQMVIISCFTTIELKIANTVGMDWFMI